MTDREPSVGLTCAVLLIAIALVVGLGGGLALGITIGVAQRVIAP